MNKAIAVGLGAVATSALVIGAFAPLALASHSWGGYHWARTANPFTLKLGDNVASSWDSYVGTTASNWSLSSVLDLAVVPGGTTRDPRRCRATNGRVEVCNASYGYNGWLGIASIWVSGLHITQGTVKVNDTYFNTATYNTPAWKNMVMCQEVGHTFGLDHQDEAFSNPNLGTCMDYTNDPARNDGAGSNLQPNQHDYDELALIYSHLDTTTTISQSLSSKAANTDLGEDASQWGKEIRKSGDGKTSLFERDFGGGQKAFTFVYWAGEKKNNHFEN